MTTFAYRAIDPNANIQIGKMTAQDEGILEKTLGMQGLTLIEAKKSLDFSLSSLFQPRFTEVDLLNLTYMLQQIVVSGISLVVGLEDVVKGGNRKNLAPAFHTLSVGVQTGRSLSEAMQERSDIFPGYYVQMIRAGEISGTLEQSIEYLMSYLEWQIEFKKSIRSLMVYPTIIFSFMGILSIILFVFVFPALIGVLTSLNAELPLPTRIIMAISTFAKDYIILIGIGLITGGAVYHQSVKNPVIRQRVDSLILRIPLIGDLVNKLNLSRYFKTLATLQASGLDIGATFNTAASVVNNSELRSRLNNVTEEILSGSSVGPALAATGTVPQLVISMVSLGEQTGSIDSALTRSSNIFDKEVRDTVKKVLAAIEPLIVICLGAMVLIIILSIFLPLYGIVGNIKGH